MQRVWMFGSIAVTGEEIDFQDPAETGPDVRERGLRIELRMVEPATAAGSVYASTGWAAGPAFCRFDLLESRPDARDRIHWHPAMTGGEPDDRVFDADLSHDPAGWMRRRLADAGPLLREAGIDGDHDDALRELRAGIAVIGSWIDRGLEDMRRPWPDVEHDERGLAVPS
ncbi:hypothetical protein WIS52_04810 [Pseudonocardia nematodicida]|uniref:DUF402 domain-containing protein n=1 Tax=Pseudonocardia nematodicida TaxID=1206997 RepID=A0ABV1K5N1_9PSEU